MQSKQMKKELFGNIDIDKIKHNSVSNIPPSFESKKKMDKVEQMKKHLFGDKYKENDIKCRDQIGMMFHLKQQQEKYLKLQQEDIEHLDKKFKEQIEKTQKEKLKNKNPFDVLYFEEPRSLNPELFEQELQVREIVKHLKSKTVKQANISDEKVNQPITINEDDVIQPITLNEDVWKKYEITNPNDNKPKIIKSTKIDINTLLEMEAKQSDQNEEREQIMDLLR
jgi:hypothetical protein